MAYSAFCVAASSQRIEIGWLTSKDTHCPLKRLIYLTERLPVHCGLSHCPEDYRFAVLRNLIVHVGHRTPRP